MEYKITETSAAVKIETKVDPLLKDQVLQEFAKCAEGTCSCPSPQYGKLDSIQVVPTESGVDIALVPRSGEVIDLADIENCLRFTAAQLGSGQRQGD